MNPKFVAFNIPDYQTATPHFTTAEEHGAYLLALMHCWQYGSLPLDDEERRKICKISKHKWRKSLREIINKFFDQLGRNKRATIEREKAIKTSQLQMGRGLRGAIKRWGGNGHGYGHGHPQQMAVAIQEPMAAGVALKKERITTTFTGTARATSTGTGIPPSQPAADPKLPPELFTVTPPPLKPSPPKAAIAVSDELRTSRIFKKGPVQP